MVNGSSGEGLCQETLVLFPDEQNATMIGLFGNYFFDGIQEEQQFLQAKLQQTYIFCAT